jgi:hypothetical protein
MLPMRDEDQQHSGAASDASPRSGQRRKSSGKLTTWLAIAFGISATFIWTFIAVLKAEGQPGAHISLDASVLVGLVGTALGAMIGGLIEFLRR